MHLVINEELQEYPELINVARFDEAIAYISEMGESLYLDMCLDYLIKARVLYIYSLDLYEHDTE